MGGAVFGIVPTTFTSSLEAGSGDSGPLRAVDGGNNRPFHPLSALIRYEPRPVLSSPCMFASLERRADFFRTSIRANLRYWAAVRVPNSGARPVSHLDWSNLIRALSFALDVPAAATDACRLMLDSFDVMEQRSGWRTWIPLLERAVAADVDPELRCRLTGHLSQSLRLDGQYQRALATIESAAEQAEALKAPVLRAYMLANLAETHRYLRHYEDAERFGREVLHVLDGLPDERRVVMSALNTLGQVAISLGRPGDGAMMMRQALALAETLDLRLYVCRLQHNLGNALSRAGQRDEAIMCFAAAIAGLQALQAAESEIASVELSRGTLHFSLGQLEPAAAAFRSVDVQALRKTGHQTLAAFAVNNLGNVLQAQGRFEESEVKMREAVGLLRGIEDPVELANALGVLGEVVAAQGRRAEAEPCWREAIALLEPYVADVRARRLLAGARKNLAERASA